MGIETRFADSRNPAAFAGLIDGRTKALFCESIGNPLGNVTDLRALADVAHAAGVPLIVDNTVPSPYLCRPFEHGADIVVHSVTKYLGGHGTTIGGAIVDSGKFPWSEHEARFKRLNEPDVSYHGVVYTEALGAAAFIGRARVVPLRNMGAALSSMAAFQILQGIETLPLRMDRICSNAVAVARHLKTHSKVGWVNYAGLEDHPEYALVRRRVSNGWCQFSPPRWVPGAVLLVAREARLLYAKAIGVQDPATKKPMARDSIFRIYSMTKPIVSVAALRLVEDGKVGLNALVSLYLPELKGLQVGVEKLV